MSKYDQPDVVRRRVRFFDGQFLQDVDFIDEQLYHLDRERGLARALRTTGVSSGLEVTATGQDQVTVSAGAAIDGRGRQLTLSSATEVHLPARFRGKGTFPVLIAYLQSEAAMATSEGSKENTRWDETPMIVALAPGEEAFAIRADQAEAYWDETDAHPVLLAEVAVTAGGVVSVNASVIERTSLRLAGTLGVGTGDPKAKLHVAGTDPYAIDLRADGRMHSATDDGGLWIGGQPAAFVGGDGGGNIGFWSGSWRLRVGKTGAVSIGGDTPGPGTRLTVNASNQHLMLRREARETTGGKQLFLELYQDDPGPSVPEVAPSIRFHHNNRYWHRIEARSDGFHLKDGNLAYDGYRDLSLQSLIATDNVTAGKNVNAAENVNAGKSVSANQNVTAAQNVSAGFTVSAGKDVIAGQSVISTKDVTAGQDIKATRDVRAGGSLTVTGNTSVSGTLAANGKVGVGTSAPKARLHVAGTDPYAIDLRADGRMHSASDDGGLWIGGQPAAFVGGDGGGNIGFWNYDYWRLRVGKTGEVSIGGNPPVPGTKLTVSASNQHLILRREATETTGGKQLFLELYQDDSAPSVPEVAPSIRFHHSNRFWHRIEARGDGFHLKEGGLDYDGYRNLTLRSLTATEDIRATRNIYADGQIYFHPGYEWGFEGPDHSRRYWYIFRPRWNINNFSDGTAVLRASGMSYPSDERLKDDATVVPDAVRTIEALRGIRFTWNEEGLRHLVGDVESSVSAGPDASPEESRRVWETVRSARQAEVDRPEIGVLAQDVERVLPELVHTDKAGYKSVDYGKLTAVLIEAVKEQQALIRDLDTRLGSLGSRLGGLEAGEAR